MQQVTTVHNPAESYPQMIHMLGTPLLPLQAQSHLLPQEAAITPSALPRAELPIEVPGTEPSCRTAPSIASTSGRGAAALVPTPRLCQCSKEHPPAPPGPPAVPHRGNDLNKINILTIKCNLQTLWGRVVV